MTHPDILTIEKFGMPYPESFAEKIGSCLLCGESVYDSEESVESKDGLFCDMECLCEYYEVQTR